MQAIVDAAPHQSTPAEGNPTVSKNNGDTSVYEEMLNDCRRKAGDATLERLRRLCQKKGGGYGTGGGGGMDEVDEGGLGDEETVIVSYHAALLGRADGAANIYGG